MKTVTDSSTSQLKAATSPLEMNPTEFYGPGATEWNDAESTLYGDNESAEDPNETNVDSELHDADSAIGDDYQSSTDSLDDDVFNYREIEGRTYHSTSNVKTMYWGCNDLKHSEMQDQLHEILLNIIHSFGEKLHKAPISEATHYALDVGTGTGQWAIEFADEYPETKITATDISPIQPESVPPNLEFQIHDISAWGFPDNFFNFIHSRLLVGCIKSWDSYIQNVYLSLKPGAWFESHEISPRIYSDDNSVVENSAMSQWGDLFVDGGKILGQPFDIVENDIQKKVMKAAGFINIQEKEYKIPIGEWSTDEEFREIGRSMKRALEMDLEGTMLFMALELEWSNDERTVFAARLRQELRSSRVHGYFRGRIVWGQKGGTA